jgi:hypothetical protein
MNIKTKIRNAVMSLGLFALLAPTLLIATATPALAHEAKCPYCKLDVVQDTKDLDNEVKLRYGNKRIEYRCVMCAIAQAKTKFKGDVTILAPSTIKGKPVLITRKGGEWSAPEGTVFIYQKGSHTKCQDLYRAATSHEAATAFAKKKGITAAKHLSLKEMVERSN